MAQLERPAMRRSARRHPSDSARAHFLEQNPASARGVVYVEFLLAFGPIFLLFLGACQFALLSTARIVVRHAAFSAVRSAVVVLEDDPARYDGAPRGSLTAGRGSSSAGVASLLGKRPKSAANSPSAKSSTRQRKNADNGKTNGQTGARMSVIRTAAYVPLLSLAPPLTLGTSTLRDALPVDSVIGLLAALYYDEIASVVTVQTARGDVPIATGTVDRNAEVTVRVTYFFACRVPIVRTLMCPSLATLLGSPTEGATKPRAGNAAKIRAAPASSARPAGQPKWKQRLDLAERPGQLRTMAFFLGGRFSVIDVQATLPNQGAAYDHPGGT